MAAAISRAGVAVRSGPFMVGMDPESDQFFRNFAVPTADCSDENAVTELIRVFEQFGRNPRLELIEELNPNLVQLLDKFGFERQAHLPVLICEPTSFCSHEQSARVELLKAHSDPVPYFTVGGIAFQDDPKITDERKRRWREAVHSGNLLCAQISEGEQVSAVGCLVIEESAAEVAGIGTLPSQRRKGLASAIVSALVQKAWARKPGSAVWLSAGNDSARSIYEKVGFRLAGHQINFGKPLPKRDSPVA